MCASDDVAIAYYDSRAPGHSTSYQDYSIIYYIWKKGTIIIILLKAMFGATYMIQLKNTAKIEYHGNFCSWKSNPSYL